MPDWVGVPEIITWFATRVADTPFGKPVEVPKPATPVTWWITVGEIAVLIHKVGW